MGENVVSWEEKATSWDKKWHLKEKVKSWGENVDILRRKSGLLRRKDGILKSVKSWRVREYGIVKKQEEETNFIFLEERHVLF